MVLNSGEEDGRDNDLFLPMTYCPVPTVNPRTKSPLATMASPLGVASAAAPKVDDSAYTSSEEGLPHQDPISTSSPVYTQTHCHHAKWTELKVEKEEVGQSMITRVQRNEEVRGPHSISAGGLRKHEGNGTQEVRASQLNPK